MLKQKVATILREWTLLVCSRVEAKWQNMSGIEGIAEIKASLPNVVGSMIIADIVATGGKAWIAEFGSGHLLDTSSPYFEEYKKSSMWNDRRSSEGNEFVGRAKGDTIHRPDGSTDVSSGKAEGMRLEHALGKLPAFQAFKPAHIIQDEVLLALPEIRQQIQVVMSEEIAKSLHMNIQVYL